MYRSLIGKPYLRVGAFVVLILALALALITVGCSSEGNSSSSSTQPPPNLHGEILFVRFGGKFGSETIFTAAANGTRLRRVSDYDAGCCPRFSPDGTRILTSALAPDGERITTAIMHANGSHRQTIPIHDPTLNLGPGAFSPDGKQIAFEGWDDNPARNGVYIGRVPDGTDLVRVTKNPANADDIPMDFSPDGSRIVILRTGIDETIKDTGAPTGSLFVVNVDGTDLHRITPPEVDVSTTARWSPNGKRIVFSGPWDELRGPIWTVRPDGTGLRKVFEDPKEGSAITPTWSPDGHKIMFGLNPHGIIEEHGSNKLSVINADGTGYEVVLDTPDGEREPMWIERE